MVPDELTIDRSRWVSRLRAFVESGPEALPASHTLLEPNAADVTDVVLPLVARRTLKRLLQVSLRIEVSAEVGAQWGRLISSLLELSDEALEILLVRPEVTAFVAGAEDNPEDGQQLLPWLGQMVVGAMVAHGGDLSPTRIPRSSSHTVALPAAATIGVLDHAGSEAVVAEVRAGEVSLAGEAVTWQPLLRFADRVDVSIGRDVWLDRTFPGVEHVAELDEDGRTRFLESLDEAARVLHGAWPEAHDELFALLRWVVPLAEIDSWYVPGMHGLIALGINSGRRQVRDLFHETSHHKLSRVLEIASASRNPEHRVFSPFAKGKGPVTSLLQSCWAFSREYELIKRLKASGYVEAESVAREEFKIRVFFDKGIPVLRREAELTELGDAVLTSIEESIA